MLCNSGWSWMFKARSMKKIRQREMLSDQFFTVGDLRWLTCCRTVGDHDPGMPNFLTKVRESDAERVRLGSGLPSWICNTSKSLLSVTWLFSSLSCTPDLFISFPVFQACIESCQRRRIGSPKWWGLPGLSKKKKNNRINNWNPSRFFQELVELLEYVVDGGTEVFRWPVKRRDFDANMEADGKCCNC